MFRLWGKLFINNHMISDTTACISGNDKRTQKVISALDHICVTLDLGRPIWLDTNIEDFRRRSKTRFTRDSFVEAFDYDYLEIQVLEED